MATIKEIKAELEQLVQLTDPRWEIYESDTRAGVQTAIKQRKGAIQADLAEMERLDWMMRHERELYGQGYELIAGIDEVGRGPLAGPVVAAAVILPKSCQIRGLDDSKKIPKSKHQTIYRAVMQEAIAVGIGIIDSQTIDRVNIYEATKLAMLEALSDLSTSPQALLIDAMSLDSPLPQQSLIKGDANSLSIAAASIVAKVTRDRMMADYDSQYPGYDFAKNAGYGTALHLAGLREYGPSPIHRRSFEPIKSMVTSQGGDR